ncbi:MAG: hypothetical protein C4617_04795 [Candidatus Liberibacter europaeus]|uniref:CD-NTase-associated protein 12/Pycsar effector protein TIR domain-containing protein n=1 Tax=Candidatus Liberibacter europaeus TaxID=744859 RepID=A0A2T4VWM7_9HYPH|nr:hypothetical protein [Candidatus Liberibacter europaeus]PTL86191.1 MAG: hypothetical protein C4617_04795 [Candidatus Liberibacter europaeus]
MVEINEDNTIKLNLASQETKKDDSMAKPKKPKITFKGDIEELKAIVKNAGLKGQWETSSDNNIQYRFNSSLGGILVWYLKGTLLFQGKDSDKTFHENLYNALSQNRTDETSLRSINQKSVFVVHGHDRDSRDQLELILHKLGISELVILQNTAGSGLTIIEELEKEIGKHNKTNHFGIVLLTPDDYGYPKYKSDNEREPRARQNVVLEMGMLLSSVGRENVVILQKGNLERPSDVQGIIYLPFNEHVKEIIPKLASRLTKAGFAISPDGISKASS